MSRPSPQTPAPWPALLLRDDDPMDDFGDTLERFSWAVEQTTAGGQVAYHGALLMDDVPVAIMPDTLTPGLAQAECLAAMQRYILTVHMAMHDRRWATTH